MSSLLIEAIQREELTCTTAGCRLRMTRRRILRLSRRDGTAGGAAEDSAAGSFSQSLDESLSSSKLLVLSSELHPASSMVDPLRDCRRSVAGIVPSSPSSPSLPTIGLADLVRL